LFKWWNSYQKLQTPPTPSALEQQVDSSGNKVEMVTVPAMGAEWSKDEMKNMTKRGRKEDKRERRSQFWKAWKRDQRGLCGKYFTRRVLVFFLFGLCVA
jgi:poly(3-hydroxybutyrate) depolymerase